MTISGQDRELKDTFTHDTICISRGRFILSSTHRSIFDSWKFHDPPCGSQVWQKRREIIHRAVIRYTASNVRKWLRIVPPPRFERTTPDFWRKIKHRSPFRHLDFYIAGAIGRNESFLPSPSSDRKMHATEQKYQLMDRFERRARILFQRIFARQQIINFPRAPLPR